MDTLVTALPALQEAFALILQPAQIMYLVLGVLLGLSVGVFPGLGGIAGLSLVLPFMFGMDPVSGLALMVGLVAVVPTSDTFASVLMGIPGSSASQATVLDGFPMARKGEAARALAAAFASSLFGGLFGATVLTGLILVARPLVLAFGTPEMLAITLLGLSMVAILAGTLPLKGVAAACLGLLVGTIGEAGAGGSLRMATYDIPYLTDGIKLVIVGLGIFAVPEIISLLRQDQSIARGSQLGAGWAQGVRDWFENRWLSVRCAVIGVVVGVIPGLGGSVVDWIAYGHTVQTAKDKSGFGKGDVRGVVGPESSNNAKEGGGLVPTLIFGIPGSGSMAIFIGGLGLLGFNAGPQMIQNDLDVTYTVVWSLALANVVGAGLCIALSGPISRLTTIRFTLLAPFLFMMISFAAFQSRQSLGDLVTLFAIGLLGIFLRRFDWSRPAFLIGFVLSSQAENFSNNAHQIATFKFRKGMDVGLEYVASPIVIGIVVLTIISVVLGLRHSKQMPTEGPVVSGKKRAPVIFLLLMLAYTVTAWINAALIDLTSDKIFPLTVGTVGIIALVLLLIRMMRAPEDDPIFADRETAGDDGDAAHGLWATLSWFGALLVLSSLLGFILALMLFLITFFRIRAGLSWARSALLTAAGIAGMCFVASTLNRDFPPGLLQEFIDMPWPFK
ncbi:tripartite tricarboxylate transporter permease [Actibacterium lipolyticum]|uniref:Tripartite tricarboxylate transporter TctA family protein n=1 Tax=Actibacterium lipolyticum TaxID=1524263 RepID=A0A238LAD4_9RHOB|nr:tripartite tricarboxylate transporter permease [Actibacterium lipolyticum]SMX51266.1 Tripartite tricarboxylate transporter TctA family protein [Actibacterium lipolyticum]